LAQAGLPAETRSGRASIVEPFLPFILQTLQKYPRLCASRVYAMVKERGYPGGPDHFRSVVARHRPRPPAEAYLRLRTLAGEQGQVDWGHFGKLQVGQAARALMAFVLVLSYSRHIFLRFYLGSGMASFLHGHVAAFEDMKGVPRTLLYDNLRSAVLERRHDAIRFHPTLLELAGHYRFAPRPVAVARGNEKGRVERAIRFVRESFFAARVFHDLDDLNAQAADWCRIIADARKWPEDRSRTVGEVFTEEMPRLLELPPNPFPTDELAAARVGKTPYARFDGNDYSVPHTHTRRTLAVQADLERVRILEGNAVIATHARSWDRGRQIEDPQHLADLVAHKRQARQHRGLDRLLHAVPASQAFFNEIAHRGGNLGATTSGLLRLLDRYPAADLDQAIAEACQAGTPHLGAVRQILDQRRAAQGQLPPVAVHLPDDPRLRDLIVRPHSLQPYDDIHQTQEELPDDSDSPRG
jgi:transposase